MSVLVGAIFGILTLALASSNLLNSPSLAAVVSAVLVDLTNSDRAAHTVGGLTVSPVLTAAAQAKADDMAARGYFAHVSPDGKNSWYWFREAGYTFIYAGENLAVDFHDSGDVVRAWMNSPTHRRNMLDGNFTEIGIATARGVYEGRPTTFVVQMFGTPARATAAVAPVQTTASPVEASEPALATTEFATTSTVRSPAAATTVASVVPELSAAPEATTTPVLGTAATGLATPDVAPWWQHLLASPKELLRYGYYALSIIVLCVLAYVTELEFHRHHTRHLVAAVVLLALMVALVLAANFLLFTEPVIAAL